MALYKLQCGSFADVDDDVTAAAGLARIDRQLAELADDEARQEDKRGQRLAKLRARLDTLTERAQQHGTVTDEDVEAAAQQLDEAIGGAAADKAKEGEYGKAVRARLTRERAELAANGPRQICTVCLIGYPATERATVADTEKPGAGCTVGPPSTRPAGVGGKAGA